MQRAAVLGAAEARTVLLSATVTGPLPFRGKLNLSGDVLGVSNTGLTRLPERLNVRGPIACGLPLQ